MLCLAPDKSFGNEIGEVSESPGINKKKVRRFHYQHQRRLYEKHEVHYMSTWYHINKGSTQETAGGI